MSEALLCVVCVFMVMWILLLMSENRRLKSDAAKLKNQLRDQLDKQLGHVEVGQGRRLTKSEVDHATKKALRN